MKMPGDLKRIYRLPPASRGDVTALTARFRCAGGTWQLRQDQADALQSAQDADGAFVVIDVGGGKTLTAMLMPAMLGIAPQDALVICPAKLRKEAKNEWSHYRRQFDVPEPGRELQYLSYTQVSHPNYVSRLEEDAPKLIVFDEIDKLRNWSSARTRRVLDYLSRHPDVKVVGMTATIGELEEWWHLARAVLGERVPLPLAWDRMTRWARATDAAPLQYPTGRDHKDLHILADAYGIEEPSSQRRRSRAALRARLTNCQGMVFSTSGSCDVPIRFTEYKPALPTAIQEAIDHMHATWMLPNGDFVDDQLRLASYERQLALGFFYKRVWEGGEDLELLYRGRAFDSAVRAVLKLRLRLIDSPKMVIESLAKWREGAPIKFNGAGEPAELTSRQHEAYQTLDAAAIEWDEVKHREWPNTEPVWVTDEVLQDVVARHADDGTIIWYSHRAVAFRLREMGLTVHLADEGTRPDPEERVVCLSTHSHAVGLNLQAWNKNIILTPSSKERNNHQLIGRTHRSGQESPEVSVVFMLNVQAGVRALRKAREEAKAFYEKTGIPRKLLE